jgi:hypothetical protein
MPIRGDVRISVAASGSQFPGNGVMPLSTTITSAGGNIWVSTDSTARCTRLGLSQVGMMAAIAGDDVLFSWDAPRPLQ